MDTLPPSAVGVGDLPADFRVFREGDIFPPLNKRIHILTAVERNFIVFIDDQHGVHHYCTDEFEYPEDYGTISERAADLEATSLLLLHEAHRPVLTRLVAESIARVLDDGNARNAVRMLDKAQAYLLARGKERARVWYLLATVTTAAVAAIAALLVWAFRVPLMRALQTDLQPVDLALCAAMGAVGAFLSVLLRVNQLKTDVSAGPGVHFFEGAMRALVGAAAGFVAALAVKADVLLGTINDVAHPIPLLLLVAAVAGASERLLPNLIRQFEGALGNEAPAGSDPPADNGSNRSRGSRHP